MKFNATTAESTVIDTIYGLGQSPENFNVAWVVEGIVAYGAVDEEMVFALIEEASYAN